MRSCGIWATPRRLVARVREPDGRLGPPLLVARTADGRQAFVDHLVRSGVDLVLVDDHARQEPLVALALARDAPVWQAPRELVQAVAGGGRPSARRLAAALASLPAVPALRPHLHRIRPPPPDDRQLLLL